MKESFSFADLRFSQLIWCTVSNLDASVPEAFKKHILPRICNSILFMIIRLYALRNRASIFNIKMKSCDQKNWT